MLQEGLTTDELGKLVVEDLKPGTYQFVETEAPFGYDLDPTPVVFEIEKGQVEQASVTKTNELSTGSVELIKIDEDDAEIKLEGAEFELQDSEGNMLQEGLTTDETGKLVVEDLKPGLYQFVETKAPYGYDLDPTPVVFTIEKGQLETVVKVMDNGLTTGSVQLIKVDQDNHEVTLEGAVFELQDSEGNMLQEGLTTDASGKLIVEDLKPGTYQFVETTAPEHYQLDDTPIVFTIEKAQEITMTVQAQNALLTGSVELLKVDQDDGTLTLEGAVFDLQDGEGNLLQADLTTDSEGKIIVKDLMPGDYQFVEVKAPTGYELNKTPITFTIEKSQIDRVNVTALNEKAPEDPQGPGTEDPDKDDGNTLPSTATNLFNLLLAGMVLLAGGIGMNVFVRKKSVR